MKLILDTHMFLWAIAEPDRIPKNRRSIIESRANRVYVSAISVAEIMIKASIGKLDFEFDPVEQVAQAGFEPLEFTARDASRLRCLPFHHRDPFDRMLISQSIERKIPILTQDPTFERYECKLVGTAHA